MTDVTLVKEVPDVMILVDSLTLRVKAEEYLFFLYGRYRKMSRCIIRLVGLVVLVRGVKVDANPVI